MRAFGATRHGCQLPFARDDVDHSAAAKGATRIDGPGRGVDQHFEGHRRLTSSPICAASLCARRQHGTAGSGARSGEPDIGDVATTGGTSAISLPLYGGCQPSANFPRQRAGRWKASDLPRYGDPSQVCSLTRCRGRWTDLLAGRNIKGRDRDLRRGPPRDDCRPPAACPRLAVEVFRARYARRRTASSLSRSRARRYDRAPISRSSLPPPSGGLAATDAHRSSCCTASADRVTGSGRSKGGAHRTAQRLLIDARAIPPLVLAMPSDGRDGGDGSSCIACAACGSGFERWIC